MKCKLNLISIKPPNRIAAFKKGIKLLTRREFTITTLDKNSIVEIKEMKNLFS